VPRSQSQIRHPGTSQPTSLDHDSSSDRRNGSKDTTQEPASVLYCKYQCICIPALNDHVAFCIICDDIITGATSATYLIENGIYETSSLQLIQEAVDRLKLPNNRANCPEKRLIRRLKFDQEEDRRRYEFETHHSKRIFRRAQADLKRKNNPTTEKAVTSPVCVDSSSDDDDDLFEEESHSQVSAKATVHSTTVHVKELDASLGMATILIGARIATKFKNCEVNASLSADEVERRRNAMKVGNITKDRHMTTKWQNECEIYTGSVVAVDRNIYDQIMYTCEFQRSGGKVLTLNSKKTASLVREYVDRIEDEDISHVLSRSPDVSIEGGFQQYYNSVCVGTKLTAVVEVVAANKWTTDSVCHEGEVINIRNCDSTC
jgi:hypothetical protein